MNRRPTGGRGFSRSTRNVRQSRRSKSHASRYQRRPSCTTRCGSDGAQRARAIMARVVEAQLGVIAARGGQRAQHVDIDGCSGAGMRRHQHGLFDALDAAADGRRHHLFDLHERSERGLLDARASARGEPPERERHHGRFVVVEQQRRVARPRRPGGSHRPRPRCCRLRSRHRAAVRRCCARCGWLPRACRRALRRTRSGASGAGRAGAGAVRRSS